MKLVRNITLGAAAALALSTSSGFAQTMQFPYGLYAGLEAGVLLPNSIKTGAQFRSGANVINFGGKLNFKDSAVVGTYLGYNIIDWLAVEGTFDYSNLGVRGHSGTATVNGVNLPTNFSVTGDVNTFTFLFNAIFHPLGQTRTFYGIKPYLGGGVGFSMWDGTLNSIGTPNQTFTLNTSRSSSTVFAADAVAGLDFAVTPAIDIGARYKFLYVDVGGKAVTGNANASAGHFTGNMITANFTYHFGVAPPPPAPVAAPAPVAPAPRTFIVFFEFDKSSLTTDGRKVVDAAAAAYQRGESVKVAGYTDAAGTQQYNLALSKKRADTVKGVLVTDGVPADAIAESWFGKENQRVPTADGVREPQNRRVEVNM